VFVYVYFEDRHGLALGVLILSGASDTLDGWIARRFHMITDLGKVIDPVADKLTQGTMIFCVAWHVRSMWFLLGLLAAKEITMGLLACTRSKRPALSTAPSGTERSAPGSCMSPWRSW
jgi:cardiolipin synthase